VVPLAAASATFKSMVFSGLFPIESEQYEALKRRRQLTLNDAALIYEPETWWPLGFGFRCGFLGLLHSRSSRSGCGASTRSS